MVKTIYTDGDYELELSSVQTETGRKIRLELRSFDWIENPSECLTIDLCPYEDIDELIDELQQKQRGILTMDEIIDKD